MKRESHATIKVSIKSHLNANINYNINEILGKNKYELC